MKKFSLFSLLIICFTRSYAQEKKFGAFAGANLSYFTNIGPFESPTLKQGGLVTLHFGLFGQKKISPKLSINSTLGFSQKGTGYNDSNNGFLLSYLNTAAHVRYTHNRLFTEIGPELGYLLTSRWIINGKPERINHVFNFFNQHFDLLANARIGGWVTKSTSLSFGISRGFINTMREINFTDENGTPIGTGSFFKNLTYQLSVCQMVF